jgi:predicted pyridoxine 5'-phosphate oxidase superfamily flavin-nucleotide-binding protein
MVKITDEMKQFIHRQKLGFVATVSSNNMPNLSPKGTIYVFDDEHLIFADIKSPQTMKNLQSNPSIEVNVVDPMARRGYRFKGTSNILLSGKEFEKILLMYKDNGIESKINAIVKIHVDFFNEITSPSYDLGHTEEELKSKWKKYYLD